MVMGGSMAGGHVLEIERMDFLQNLEYQTGGLRHDLGVGSPGRL